ncbi:hypothetical protein SISSUDRAFT_56723 [Sistotremastrum suecicum HHB10207 ss-3]|uniref:Uncharacterized protein n=1 Tax=Sistotremastrum suecicum HHB10207 ss-3 TaxID=1314776 RepID=A0A166BQ89_9AGAM|nr:hypothetical protein SISSUDRAFT_56723 [Sistotremastrum suecicum HHB10207 ss-3]
MSSSVQEGTAVPSPRLRLGVDVRDGRGIARRLKLTCRLRVDTGFFRTNILNTTCFFRVQVLHPPARQNHCECSCRPPCCQLIWSSGRIHLTEGLCTRSLVYAHLRNECLRLLDSDFFTKRSRTNLIIFRSPGCQTLTIEMSSLFQNSRVLPMTRWGSTGLSLYKARRCLSPLFLHRPCHHDQSLR